MRKWIFRSLAALALLAGAAVVLLHVLVRQWEPPPMEAAFAGRPMPVRRTLPLGRGRAIHYAETGAAAGPLVVLIHGTPGRWQDFDAVLTQPELAERALLVAVDRLGWGGSSAGGLAPSLTDQAAAIAAVLRAHGRNRPAILVGHSLGGAVAPRVAMDFPDLVDGLVLVAGSIDPALEKTTWYQALARLPPIRWAIPAPLARSDEELLGFRDELRAMLPRWKDVRCPVVIVQGEDDALVPAANADFAARVLTHAPTTIERLPGQGHLIPWERPDRIVAAVERLLPSGGAASRATRPGA